MNKQEFIDRLTAALNGRIPAPQVEDTIQYYQDYINTQIRSGKSETGVMSALGDPRLIARTIIETAQPTGESGTAYNTTDNYRRDTYENSNRSNYKAYQDNNNQTVHKSFRMPGWLVAILIFLVVILVLSVVFRVLAFLAPVIIVVTVVMFLVKLFRDWLN